MPTQVPIKVFRIGHTVVDKEEVQRWMDHIGAHDFEIPDDEDITNPALLIALAGKRCYMSFQKGLNPNITRIREDFVEYFDNILASGHGCYDAETDVLTSEGWVAWPDVTQDMQLATRRQDGVIEYHQPTHLIAEPYQGRMYRVESNGVDLFVTPNHNMFVVQTTTRQGRKRQDADYKLIRADELNTKSHAYVKTGIWEHPDGLSSAVLALLGFAIGDAAMDGNGRRLRFHLRRQRKIAWLLHITAVLGWELQHTDGDDHYTVIVPDSDGLRELFGNIYADDGHKQIPSRILMTQSRRGLLGLLNGLLQSDGSNSDTGDSFDTTSPYLSDQMYQLCLHVGIAANLCYEYGPEQRPTSFGDKPLTRLWLVRRNLRPEVNKFAGQVGKSSWIEDWEGMVYCAQVPNNTLYVRRNGIPVWCGNSVLEHSVYNFAIEGISRVFTAEMNRHRAGWAISEGSLRFIRFGENIPYWEPDSIAGNNVAVVDEGAITKRLSVLWPADPLADDSEDAYRTLTPSEQKANLVAWAAELGFTGEQLQLFKRQLSRIIFHNAFRTQENQYRILEAIWADELAPESKFAGKKQITSMMRRIIGLGVATGGVWSGNIRAIRHVFTMRASEQAEEEMLHVFSRLVVSMAEKEPMLFGDFMQDKNGFWRPKYVKV